MSFPDGTYEELRRELEQARKRIAELETELSRRGRDWDYSGVVAALQESEGKYRLLAEKMNDMVWTADRGFNFTYVSPSVEKILGYTPQERLGRKSSSLMTPESAAKALDTFVTELQRDAEPGVDPDRSVLAEVEMIHKNGSRVWLEVNSTFVRDDAGNVIGAHGVSRDITERVGMREELKRQHERLECLVRERTAELTEAYERLRVENESRKATEAALRVREQDLEELNAALRALLRQREDDKRTTEMNLMSNLKLSVLPNIDKLEQTALDEGQRAFLAIVKSNLRAITSPFIQRVSSGYMGFTPGEIQIASLIREGKSSKEIARIMTISVSTVHTYRNRIRKKTNTRNSKVNLMLFLRSLG